MIYQPHRQWKQSATNNDQDLADRLLRADRPEWLDRPYNTNERYTLARHLLPTEPTDDR